MKFFEKFALIIIFPFKAFSKKHKVKQTAQFLSLWVHKWIKIYLHYTFPKINLDFKESIKVNIQFIHYIAF